MRIFKPAVFAAGMITAFAGVAHAQATSDPVKTDKYAIDAQGMITLEDDFVDEMYCTLDTLETDTVEKAGAALAADTWPDEVDRDFQLSRDICTDEFDWAPREGELSIVVASTQTLINHALAVIKTSGVDYDDIVAIEEGLTPEQNAKFSDGSWLKDDVMLARLQGELRTRGLTDANLAMGEMAIGAYANQVSVIASWVDFLEAN